MNGDHDCYGPGPCGVADSARANNEMTFHGENGEQTLRVKQPGGGFKWFIDDQEISQERALTRLTPAQLPNALI
jgi:hypothetical protein